MSTPTITPQTPSPGSPLIAGPSGVRSAETGEGPTVPASNPIGLPASDSGVVHRLGVLPWHDPSVEADGFDPRSPYVETFWLPLLGPSTTLLLRRTKPNLTWLRSVDIRR